MSTFTDEVARLCEQEYKLHFWNGSKKEWMEGAYQRIGVYWNQLATNPKYKKWSGYNGRSDTVLAPDGTLISSKNQPWSAAFISWVAHEAGASSSFKYSPSHSSYVVAALRAAKSANSVVNFVARRHGTYKPKVGDLIACERRPDVDPTFDTYIDYVAQSKYEAHCDFVVHVGASRLTVVGGNISNTVTKRDWPTSGGLIQGVDPARPDNNVICVIECRL